MIHYGDITKIHGDQVPAVHVITGGSPCQDLSVAGKRAGLAGERSGLFMEQIRIVKEMRENDRRNYAGADNADRLIRPRFMVWENVPGAFSSNKGEDFRAVLEETAKVAEKDAVIPEPPKGKWTPAGCIMGDGWSIAWRVHDAQFWGVPQRRKRIALVADFGGECAPEILFERESVSGDTEKSGKEGQETAGDAGAGAEETGGLIAFEPGAASRVGGHAYEDVAGTVRANAGDNQQAVVYGISSYDSNGMKSDNPHSGIYQADTSRTLDLNGGNPGCNQGGMVVLEGNGSRPSHQGDGYAESETQYNFSVDEEKVGTCVAKGPNAVCKAVDCLNGKKKDVNGTLAANARKSLNSGNVVRCESVVRRLTPLEAERLQGFPDNWTNIGDWVDSKGKIHKGESDSPRYKALGNSIALPFWQWMAERMMPYLPENPTMASLFDGIGGFPLVFSRCGCKPVWASEIEEFPIAVTKRRFPEE